MEILDEKIEGRVSRKRVRWYFYLLAVCCILAGLVELISIYLIVEDKVLHKTTTLFRCFYNPYPYRPYVQYVNSFGTLISIVYLLINRWKLPDAKLERTILLGPLFIYLVDKFIIFIMV